MPRGGSAHTSWSHLGGLGPLWSQAVPSPLVEGLYMGTLGRCRVARHCRHVCATAAHTCADTHLWVQDLPALRGDHDILGVLECQGDQWSQGVLGGRGDRLDRAGQWRLGLAAASGVQPVVQFALGREGAGGSSTGACGTAQAEPSRQG